MTINKEDQLAALFPETAKIIIEAIGGEGEEFMINLSKRCYERIKTNDPQHLVNLSIPKHIPNGHWLNSVAGCYLAKKLATIFSGEVLVIPKLQRLHKYKRNKQLLKKLGEGVSKQQLAAEFGLTYRCVNQIIRKAKARAQAGEQAEVATGKAGGGDRYSLEGQLVSGLSRPNSVDNQKEKAISFRKNTP